MSRTYKDARQNRVLEVIKNTDSTFDLFLNSALHRGKVPEATLSEELCVRFGFCGDEYQAIVRELNLRGRKQLFLS